MFKRVRGKVWLDKNKIEFPDPPGDSLTGLLAYGGDLSIDRLKLAYSMGIFPWYLEGMPIIWYSPLERFVLFPDKVKISKSMKSIIGTKRYEIRVNTSFKQVISMCASIKRIGQESTWITPEMSEAYVNLHEAGMAMSIEVFRDNILCGGLYGVLCGKVFCGESMFSLEPNTSKLALIYLCQKFNFELIDCQVHTEHMERMGAEFIDASLYRKFLST